jgi:hypothetical protein
MFAVAPESRLSTSNAQNVLLKENMLHGISLVNISKNSALGSKFRAFELIF